MILRSAATLQASSWQKDLSEAITDSKELCRHLNLTDQDLIQANMASQQFALKVPRPFANRMEKGNPKDPLFLQIWPQGQELTTQINYLTDPLGEKAASPQVGVIHKYHGRVLLIGSPTCAINCRYCFRRHYPYEENMLNTEQYQAAFNYIQQETSIAEVILSGGDPLVSSNKRLAWVVTQLEAIPHVKRLRIHTRLPIVIPNRVDDGFLSLLQQTTLQTVIVVHSNHSNEIDSSVSTALTALRQVCTVLNQAVLLKQVNDNKQALTNLNIKLFEAGVLPYYLHLLDKVHGAAHFDIPEADAIALVKELSHQLPGYLVPKLVREDAGAKSKTLIAIN